MSDKSSSDDEFRPQEPAQQTAPKKKRKRKKKILTKRKKSSNPAVARWQLGLAVKQAQQQAEEQEQDHETECADRYSVDIDDLLQEQPTANNPDVDFNFYINDLAEALNDDQNKSHVPRTNSQAATSEPRQRKPPSIRHQLRAPIPRTRIESEPISTRRAIERKTHRFWRCRVAERQERETGSESKNNG